MSPETVKAILFSASAAALPPAPRDASIVDDFHGRKIADPFRPLENLDAKETLKWAKAQNKRTQNFIKAAKASRTEAIAWHREIQDYVREGIPGRYGDNYFSYKQDGLAPQPVYLVREKSIDATPRILLDPNTLSKDGTVALQTMNPSPDGKLLAYTVSEAGSDTQRLRIRDVATGQDLPDDLKNLRFTDATWDPDGKGLIYSMPLNEQGQPDEAGERFVMFHHTLGEDQSKDVQLYERADVKNGFVGAYRMHEKDDVLFVNINSGTDPDNGLAYRKGKTGLFQEILPVGKASLSPFHRDGNTLYATTNLDAPRGRIVAIDLTSPDTAQWRTIVSEDADPGKKLEGGFVAGGKLFVSWKEGGADKLEVRTLNGDVEGVVPTPLGVSISMGKVSPTDKKFLLGCSGYLAPNTRYEYDIDSGKLTLVKKSAIKRDLTGIAKVERLFAPSKDGTKVPMWVISPKDLKKDGTAATLLYGYGGFNVSLEPGYDFDIAHWVEQGGVYVVSNLRGGGEFGKPWYDAGRLQNKQNVFDDFAACAEELVKQGYTKPARLAIDGGSNGGLLTAATMLQRPDLFGAVISEVPVTDMLRFHKHDQGKAWMSDYGDPDTNKADFEASIKYSPLHNVKPAKDVKYPPTLIMTADHDNRVTPAHAYKLAATLQENGHLPSTYLRVESRAGHGAGKPTEKVIQEAADKYAFLVRTLGPLKP